jgi:hypothetical protein
MGSSRCLRSHSANRRPSHRLGILGSTALFKNAPDNNRLFVHLTHDQCLIGVDPGVGVGKQFLRIDLDSCNPSDSCLSWFMNDFDPYSQQALALARKEADKFSTFYVGNEHLLLGILGLPNCTGDLVLQRLGVDTELLKKEIIARMPTPGPKPPGGNIPYTPEVKKTLALANKEANQMSAGFVGTEHLLLGMLRIDSGTVYEALIQRSVSLATLRDAVRSILGLAALPAEDTTTAVMDTSITRALNFTMWIDPGDSSIEDVKELFMAASDLHRSFGGKGLLFVKDEQQKPLIPCSN